MPGELVDRGHYISFKLIGMEYVDRTIEHHGSERKQSGLFVGLVVENHSNETCRWYESGLEIIDTSGFAYFQEDPRDIYYVDEIIPGGWYNELDDLKPNRKYRHLAFVKDFHGEVSTISFEKKLRSVVSTVDIDDRKQVERLEIDVSHLSEDEVDGLPEIVDAFAEYS